NYEIYDCELLAIMLALEEFRRYLISAHEPFEIWSDHMNLQYFKLPQKLNHRQARWLTELQDFHFTIHHLPGSANSRADLLSQRPGFDRGVNDNDNVVLLPPALFSVNAVSLETNPALPSLGIHELTPISYEPRILRARLNQDQMVTDALARKEKEWSILPNGLITFRNRVYVPRDMSLRADIIANHHDTPIAGHPGQHKTLELILRDYWWPRIAHDVRRYVEGCETCQRTEAKRTPRTSPLHPHEPPTRPWEVITMDIIGPLPESQGYNAILVIVDWLTKAVKFEATHMELTSEGTARILRERIFRDHGLPRRIIHDRDPRFVSDYLRQLLILLGVKQNPSTAYHPQTDGQTERMNQEIEHFLRVFTNYQQDDWKDWLSIAEFTHNNSVHSATGTTPFMLNVGQHPWTGQDTRREMNNEAAMQFAEKMKRLHADAAAGLRQATDKMKRSHNAHSAPAVQLNEGDQVYLEATSHKTGRPSKKRDDKRFGPFKVKKKVGAAAYELDLPENWPAIHPVFHESLLTLFKPAAFRKQKRPLPPDPVIVDDEPHYEVEAILDSKRKRKKLFYLVSWKGYPCEHNSWEPFTNLEGSEELVADFHRQHPNKASPTNTIRHIEIVDNDDSQTVDPTRISDPARLYNEVTGEHGKKFKRRDSRICYDAITTLSTSEVDSVLEQQQIPAVVLDQLTPSISRLWIMEKGAEQISAVVLFRYVMNPTPKPVPVRCYCLLDPLTKSRLCGFYDFSLRPSIFTLAPPWLPRDYYQSIKLVWSN